MKARKHMPISRLSRPEREALHWLIQRRDDESTIREESAYHEWLAREPEHRQASAKMQHYWDAMDQLQNDPEIVALTDTRARVLDRRARRRRFSALAASMVVALGVGWMLGESGISIDPVTPIQRVVERVTGDDSLPESAYSRSIRTAVGQNETVALADGSQVTLDTDSLIRTHHSEGETLVLLKQGRAYFKVAPDASRRFVVRAHDKTVVATGTEFAVDVEHEKGVAVTLVEGSVRVETRRGFFRSLAAVDLDPGWQLVADDELKPEPVNLERAVSWTSGRLHFLGDSIGVAAAAMNRYSDKKIVIRDAAIRDQPIIGNFRAGDIDAFVRAVRLHGFAEVTKESDERVELGLPGGDTEVGSDDTPYWTIPGS